MKSRLEAAVEAALSGDDGELEDAVDTLRSEMQTATSSMTSVPKPLKFLSPFYDKLRELHAGLDDFNPNKAALAEVLSVLGMVNGAVRRDALRYCLLAGTTDVGAWGHDYLRHLAGEIGATFDEMTAANPDADVSDLMALVDAIVPYNMEHNAEAEAVDLLLEMGSLVSLPTSGYIDEHNYQRVCAYLLQCADYLGDADEVWEVLDVAFVLYLDQSAFNDALRVALRLGANSGAGMVEGGEALERRQVVAEVKCRIAQAFLACPDAGMRAQMALTLAAHRASFDFFEDLACASHEGGVEGAVAHDWHEAADAFDDEEAEKLQGLAGNSLLAEMFGVLARELDAREPKTPEDIYKSHLVEGGGMGAAGNVQSARGNLASTYVNAFANAGFGTDKLVTSEDASWLGRNKDDAKLAVAASVGLLHAWNEDELSAADKYLHAADANVRAGGLLALGCIGAALAPETDPVLAVVGDFVDVAAEGRPAADDKPVTPRMKAAGMLSLGIAYAGSGREDVAELLYPYLRDSERSMDLAAHAALALGLVLVGTASEEAAAAVIDRLMVSSAAELQHALAKHMVLGLGLLFLGQGSAFEASAEMLQALPQVAADGQFADAEAQHLARKAQPSTEDAADASATKEAEEEDRTTMVAVDTPAHNLERFARVLLRACAHAGTGNVLETQHLLHLVAEHPESEAAAAKEAAKDTGEDVDAGESKTSGAAAAGAGAARAPEAEDSTEEASDTFAPTYAYQSAAVLGIALVALGEGISVDMLTRTAEHLLQYGDASVKRGVPLALALAHASDPAFGIVDLLSKLSHDGDALVAQGAIFALGIVGAGTNNSRIAGLLRALTAFYSKDADKLFMTRIAQGLVHAGKGLVTLAPLHSDRLLMAPASVGALMAALVAAMDPSATLHGQYHYLLFALTPALRPRSVITVDTELKPVKVDIRVGQAVETVGQAGRPKRITGFQTHTSPVLLATGERAELADTDEWEALSSVLEGVIILRKKQASPPSGAASS